VSVLSVNSQLYACCVVLKSVPCVVSWFTVQPVCTWDDPVYKLTPFHCLKFSKK